MIPDDDSGDVGVGKINRDEFLAQLHCVPYLSSIKIKLKVIQTKNI